MDLVHFYNVCNLNLATFVLPYKNIPKKTLIQRREKKRSETSVYKQEDLLDLSGNK